MAEPELDKSNGWWFIRYRTGRGTRAKKTILKDARWSKGGSWPGDRKPKCPSDVQLLARPFQDMDTAARLGRQVKIPRKTPLPSFLESYRKSYSLSQKPDSLRLLSYAIRLFLAYCKGANVSAVEQVSRRVCRAFLDDLAGQDLSFNTCNSAKGLLGGAFNRAIDDGLIEVNPWHRIKVPGTDDSEATPSWTLDEVSRLKAELKGWAHDLFIVGINSGFRCRALMGLEWRDVQFSVPRRKYGRLICRKELSKGGKAYSVPLVGELHDTLAKRHLESEHTGPTGRVFPGRVPSRSVHRSSFRDAIKAACRRAKIEFPGSAWHSMRATFATLAHGRGVNPRAIQAWMNHSSIAMTDRYSHYTSDMDDSEAAKLEADENAPGTSQDAPGRIPGGGRRGKRPDP